MKIVKVKINKFCEIKIFRQANVRKLMHLLPTLEQFFYSLRFFRLFFNVDFTANEKLFLSITIEKVLQIIRQEEL